MVAVFGVGDRDFYCKQCGYAVCSACSTNKKFLSKDGKEKFRVCDLCDTKLDNIRLRLNFDKLCALKDDKIGLSDKLLQQLKEQKAKLQLEIEAEKAERIKALNSISERIDKERTNTQKFNQQLTDIKVEISFQNQK